MKDTHFLCKTTMSRGDTFSFHETVKTIEVFNSLTRNEMLDFFTTNHTLEHVVEGKLTDEQQFIEVNDLLVELRACNYSDSVSWLASSGVIVVLRAIRPIASETFDLTKLVPAWDKYREDTADRITYRDRWYPVPLLAPVAYFNGSLDAKILDNVENLVFPTKYRDIWCATELKPDFKAKMVTLLKTMRGLELRLKNSSGVACEVVNSLSMTSTSPSSVKFDTNLSDILAYDCNIWLDKNGGILSILEIDGMVEVLTEISDKIVGLELGPVSVLPPMQLLETVLKQSLTAKGIYKDFKVSNLGKGCYVTIK